MMQSQVTKAQSQGYLFQKLKLEDADLHAYLDQIKYVYGKKSFVFNYFQYIMKECKGKSIDILDVIKKVSYLFLVHPQLIVGFNAFLPLGYRIEVQPNNQVQVSMSSEGGAESYSTFRLPANKYIEAESGFKDAISYVEQIKYVYGYRPDLYKKFLDTMHEYKASNIDILGIIVRFSQLFQDHPHLIIGFNAFLPPGCGCRIEIQPNKEIQIFMSHGNLEKVTIITGFASLTTESNSREVKEEVSDELEAM